MKCEVCGKTDAVVQYTEIKADETSSVHLCQSCAAERGIDASPIPPNFALSNLVAQIGQEPSTEGVELEGSCPFCGLTLGDFRDNGRFGCPHCYEAFESGVRSLLRRIHGSTQHTGKVYLPTDPTRSERQRRASDLRKKLERAVQTENFERAARIRDELRALERA